MRKLKYPTVEIWTHENSLIYIVIFKDGTALMAMYTRPKNGVEYAISERFHPFNFPLVKHRIRQYKQVQNARRYARRNLF